MNSELNARTVVLILLVFGSILGSWFWTGLRAQDFEGASHMHLDPQGRLYIQVGNRLFQYEADGRFGRTFDLADIGVDALSGGFAFFSNGDILLSRQSYARSFFQRIRILKRQRNTSGEYRQDGRESLVRCDLPAKRCSPFGERALNLNQAFHLYIDPLHDEVYLAEGARHQVRKFDAAGRETARLDRGLKFPNQVFAHEGRLYIANTNRHEILMVDTADKDFGHALARVDTESKEIDTCGARWPSSMLIVNGELWVNNMNQDMRSGRISVFDAQGGYRKTVSLQANADPIDLVLFRGSVLISDYGNFTVYRLGLDGTSAGEFPEGALKSFLSEQQTRHNFYAGLSRGLLWLFWGTLAAGFLVGIVQGLQLGSIKSLRALGVTSGIDIRNPGIVWVSPDPAYRGYLRLSVILFSGFLLLVGMLGLYTGIQPILKLLFLLVMGGTTVLFLFYRINTYKIGVFEDVLILMKGKRYQAGRGGQVLYSDSHLVIGNITMPMGSAVKSFFPRKPADRARVSVTQGGNRVEPGPASEVVDPVQGRRHADHVFFDARADRVCDGVPALRALHCLLVICFVQLWNNRLLSHLEFPCLETWGNVPGRYRYRFPRCY